MIVHSHRTALITNHTDNYVHTVLRFTTISNFSKFDVHSSGQHAERKRAARSMLELRAQRGLASLDNNGGQLANQIGRNSRVFQSTMELPALTYTCTD